MPIEKYAEFLMKLYAVIHMKLQDRNAITLVVAEGEQEAKEVYLKHIGLPGRGTQLKVEEIDTTSPSVICTLFEGEEDIDNLI
jgi:hypothetical protein